MRFFIGFLFVFALLINSPAHAVMEDYPSIKLQGLDKSVGRTVTFEATVGSTIQYGPLFIKIHACRKAPPIEKPESAAFLQIWEVPPGAEKSEWAFSGWMFASSPALSAMDHPVYDVWILDCLGKEEPNAEAQAAQSGEEADQADLAPAEDAVDSEAEDPAAEEVAPMDSEAEDQSVETLQPAPVVPSVSETTDPNAAYVPMQPGVIAPEAVQSNSSPAPVPSTDQDGFTAYDLMR